MNGRRGGGERRDFTCRVSDVYQVPRRGHMLRLKVIDGEPSMKDFERGGALRLESPEGGGREVRILDVGVTSGRARPERLERYREVDLLVSSEDALAEGRPVRIGWLARRSEDDDG